MKPMALTLPSKHTLTEKLPITLLFLVFALYLLDHVNDFYVPTSDFFDYADKAVQLKALRFPEHFKRPPLFSLLLALISAPLPGKTAELYAGEALAFLGALGAFVFLYRIGSRLLGRWAIVPVWLWALHPSTLIMALAPKPDMPALMVILWAVDRFLAGDRKAYLLAFAGTLLRYEGAVVIAAFFLCDFFLTREKGKAFLHAMASGAFIVLWTLFQGRGEGGASYGSYFSDYRLNLHFFDDFARKVFELPPLPFKWIALPAAVLLLFGLLRLWDRSRRAALLTAAYGAGFAGMHVIWPFSSVEYVILGAWNVLLVFSVGLKGATEEAQSLLRRISPRLLRHVAVLLLAAAVPTVILIRNRLPQDAVSLPVIIGALFVLVLFLSAERPFFSAGKVFALALALPAAVLLNGAAGTAFYTLHYNKAEYRLAGEWFEKNRRPGEKMAVDQPTIVAYFTSLDKSRDFVRLVDLPAVPPDSLHTWLRSNGVAYIAWLSSHRLQPDGDAWYKWKVENRNWRTVDFLREPNGHPGYELAETIRCGPRFALIYRLTDLNPSAEN